MTTTLSTRIGGQRSTLERALTKDELRDLGEVLEHAQDLFRSENIPQMTEIDDFAAASTALNHTRRTVIDALQTGEAAVDRLQNAPSLMELVERIGAREHQVRSAEVRSRNAAVRTAWEALAELQDVVSVPQLIKLGTEAVCRLGFDRAIVSQVADSTWTTESIHVEGDPEWASEILAAGREQPENLTPGLPELDIVRRRKPIVVTRVQERQEVHRAVASASRSRSYVAAPIMPRSTVIGFLHGDRYFHRGEVTQFDCDLLGLFAQGFGFALERAMMAAQLEQMREQIRGLSHNLTSVADSVDSANFSLASPSPSASSHRMEPTGLHPQPQANHDDRLTRREQEVLRLMAEGMTNQRIASRLIISEGTVKTHVKHILRKLRAANRAEAVARWHGQQRV